MTRRELLFGALGFVLACLLLGVGATCSELERAKAAQIGGNERNLQSFPGWDRRGADDSCLRATAPELWIWFGAGSESSLALVLPVAGPAVSGAIGTNAGVFGVEQMPVGTDCLSGESFVEVTTLQVRTNWNYLHVGGIHASRAPTKVVQRHSFWDWPVRKLISETMRSAPATLAVGFDAVPSVPSVVDVSEPEPTSLDPSGLVDLPPVPDLVGDMGAEIVQGEQGIPVAPPPRVVPDAPPFCSGGGFTAVDETIHALILTYDWPCWQALAVMRCESDSNPNAVSQAGAVGLFQIHPYNAANFDPATNIAAAYRKYLYGVSVGNPWRDWNQFGACGWF